MLAQNRFVGTRGSNEYPQSMFLSRKKKNNVYPCKPQFYYTKVGFRGVKIIKACICDVVILFNLYYFRCIVSCFKDRNKANRL